MRTISVGDSTTTVIELVEQAKKEPLLLRERNGRMFVMLAIDDAEAEAWLLGNNVQFLRLVERSRARARQEGWLTTSEVRRQLRIAKKSRPSKRRARRKPKR